MKFTTFLTATLSSLLGHASAALSPLVSGTPVGFAASVTGGGTASPVYPTTIAQLKTYLTSSSPQVIVLSGTYDFSGSEGTSTYAACNAYSCTPDNGGQALLNTLSGCGSTATYSVSIDTAAYNPIWITSYKTLIGTNGATIKGKGFRLSGVSNVIIQNVEITNLNPKYVWGGDAIAMTDTNGIWIDHVTTSLLGRQHYSFGTGSNNAVTISNSFIDGGTTQSATCDGHTYWALELVGSGDFITFYRNWVYYTSGRSPALSGNTVFHAVNNVWSANTGHLIEGTTTTGTGLYEGNYFLSVPIVVGSGIASRIFASEASYLTTCASYIGRNCVENVLGSGTGSFTGHDTASLVNMAGRPIAPASAASSVANSVINNAGNTL